MNTCTSRPTASARSTLRCPAGSRVSPKSESRAGRSTSPGSSRNRAHAPSTRSAGSGTPIRSRSRRQSSACHTPSAGTARHPPPRAQARTISGRCSAYRSNSSARCRTALNRRARRAGSDVLASIPRDARPSSPTTAPPDTHPPPRAEPKPPAPATTDPHPPRSQTPSPPHPQRASAATGSRRSRTPHRPAHPPPRADPTSAARATAPCRAWARRRPPARTGRAAGRPEAREAPRPGRRPAQLDGCEARRRVCLARSLDRAARSNQESLVMMGSGVRDGAPSPRRSARARPSRGRRPPARADRGGRACASSSRNCADWKPLAASNRSRKVMNWRGVIVSSTSICATTVLRIVSMRLSVWSACGVSPSSRRPWSCAPSWRSSLNHSS